ncbi:MAG: 3'(2'),5'-bisphosphate nucleotidase CysQ [bacterium]|nr:3'(2'),5'-bisphosphate nucleotidase CysQ [bacterium]
MMNLENLLFKAVKASLAAGEAIMEIYSSDNFNERAKEDNSPLTEADISSHNIIENFLLDEGIMILSEEGTKIPYNEREKWDVFWLIDPLDGTKEFLKKNGEFTVNIALIKNQTPIMGVVFAPVLKKLYFSIVYNGAFLIDNIDSKINLNKNLYDMGVKLPLSNLPDKYTVVASRSHMTPETKKFIDGKRVQHGGIDLVSIGSSLKLCLVAEGMANIYPRFAPTMEWDTGAGHAIVLGAGGEVTNWETKKELIYNKKNLLNPWFLVDMS